MNDTSFETCNNIILGEVPKLIKSIVIMESFTVRVSIIIDDLSSLCIEESSVVIFDNDFFTIGRPRKMVPVSHASIEKVFWIIVPIIVLLSKVQLNFFDELKSFRIIDFNFEFVNLKRLFTFIF